MTFRRSLAYYLTAVVWFGSAAFMFGVSSGNGSLYKASGLLYFSGWIVIAVLSWREYMTLKTYLEREQPQYYDDYIGIDDTDWFRGLLYWRFLFFTFRSAGNSDDVLREHKRAFKALFIILVVAFSALFIAQSFCR